MMDAQAPSLCTRRRRGCSYAIRRLVVSTLLMASLFLVGQLSAQQTPPAANGANGAGEKFTASDLFYRAVRVNHDDLDSVLQGFLPV